MADRSVEGGAGTDVLFSPSPQVPNGSEIEIFDFPSTDNLEVKKLMQPSVQRKEKQGKTPWALCTEEHRDLKKDGEKWIRETAAQSMLVVFSAAFTVPGGHSQQTDTPISLMVFGVSDGVALFTSSTSILMFLSILTSRYSEQDFLQSLPSRLMFGFTTLFVSITAMMITFTITSFIAYRHGLAWIPILIALFATVPASVFASLQYPLLADVINSTYGSRLLFKPRGSEILALSFEYTLLTNIFSKIKYNFVK